MANEITLSNGKVIPILRPTKSRVLVLHKRGVITQSAPIHLGGANWVTDWTVNVSTNPSGTTPPYNIIRFGLSVNAYLESGSTWPQGNVTSYLWKKDNVSGTYTALGNKYTYQDYVTHVIDGWHLYTMSKDFVYTAGDYMITGGAYEFAYFFTLADGGEISNVSIKWLSNGTAASTFTLTNTPI